MFAQTGIGGTTDSENWSKSALSVGNKNNNVDFTKIYNDVSEDIISLSNEVQTINEEPTASQVPPWVDIDYGYQASRPRMPNLREVIEAMTNQSIEDLQIDPNVDFTEIVRSATELLYGVGDTEFDKRNWKNVFASHNLIASIQEESSKMHNPTVKVFTEYDSNGDLSTQHAAIISETGATLRILNEGRKLAEHSLKNFGVNANSIPLDFNEQIRIKNFDTQIIELLSEFISESDSKDIP